jgi:hypothetical protein
MTSAAPAIAILRAAFPGREFPNKTIELYGRLLADLDPEAVTRAVERLIMGSEFLPTIHAIRREVAEEKLSLPSPEEAWDIVLRGGIRYAAPEVRDACDAVGGRWTVLHTDQLPTVRAQFLKSYGERRRTAIEEWIGARRPELARSGPPLLNEASPTMASLPETTSGVYLPVHARFVRRAQGLPLDDPTEAEKAHAIRVLEEGPPEFGEPDEVYREAERIFAEAGISR